MSLMTSLMIAAATTMKLRQEEKTRANYLLRIGGELNWAIKNNAVVAGFLKELDEGGPKLKFLAGAF